MGLPEERIAAATGRGDVSAAVGQVLQGYAGPALHLDGVQVVAANAPAAALLPALASQWGELLDWLHQGARSALLLKVMQEEAVSSWEWNAVVFPADQRVLLGRNVSVEHSLTSVLTESRDRFRDLIELSADLAWETDVRGRFVYVAGGAALGYKPDDMVGRPAGDFIVFRADRPVGLFETHEAYEGLRATLRRKDGSHAEVLVTAKPVRSPAGIWQGARGVCHDVTEQLKHQQELAWAQRRDQMVAQLVKGLRDAEQSEVALLEGAKVIQATMGASGCTIYAADADGQLRLAAQAGLSPPELVLALNRKLSGMDGVALHEKMNSNTLLGAGAWGHGRMNGTIWVWRASDDGVWSFDDEEMMVEVADHLGIALTQFDYRERLRILSECDGLTRLLNRRTFTEKLNEKMAEARPQPSAVFYLDLDNFKQVNDQHGHQRGDMVIRRLGEILQHTARPGDLAGRIGGDEFVLWLDNVDAAAAAEIAERLVASAGALRELSASPDLPLGVSVGVALAEAGQKRRAISLLQLADGAMYQAKKNGKSSWALARELKLS